jgi:PmbA protein
VTDLRREREEVEALASWLLDRAVSYSEVTGADVLYFFSESHSLSLLDGAPEENSSGVSGGIGLRLIGEGGRQGVAYGNNFSRGAMNNMLDWSRANCLASEPEEGITLYSGPIAEDLDLDQYDASVAVAVTPEMRMNACLEMTREARARDPRIVSVRSASWGDGVGESFYASTAGVCGWKRATSISCGTAVVLQDGESFEMGAYGKGERHLEDVDFLSYAAQAVDKTTRILGGKPLKTGKYTLLLDPEVSASLIDEIGELFCASDVHRGRSLMKGKLGTRIAGKAVTLVDDARLPRRLGSSSFDGEGAPTGRTVLIESGAASSYLYNLQYAAKDGVASTGNASRSLSSLPDVGTSNLILSPGAESADSLLRGTENGFWVLELMGLHTLNPVSGDFSLGAKGLHVKNGVPGAPVAGVTISGNLLDMLQKITAVGSDLEFFGSSGASTVVVEDVAVAGN